MGAIGLLVKFYLKQEFGVSVQGLSAFLLPVMFPLTFDIAVTVHVNCLVHTPMFQAHDESLKCARSTWMSAVIVLKCREFVEPVLYYIRTLKLAQVEFLCITLLCTAHVRVFSCIYSCKI